MSSDLISKKTRAEFRERLVDYYTLREIETEFNAADLLPDETFQPSTSGQRRSLVEQYYHAIDFSNWNDVRKVLQTYESILAKLEHDIEHPPGYEAVDVLRSKFENLKRWLSKDGFSYNDGRLSYQGQAVHLPDVGTAARALDVPELLRQIERMRGSVETDPALAIGTAKELVETTCKTILLARGLAYAHDADVSELVKLTRKELGLMPDAVPNSAKGADTIKRLLSNLGTVAQALGELRNLYGTGHGREGNARGLSPRHARLAVGSAATLAVFLLETHQERRQ